MKRVTALLVMAVYSCAHAATIHRDPAKTKDDVSIADKYFNESTVVYRGQHEITKIYFPIFLFEKHVDNDDKILFIVEADKNDDGSQTDQGLYVSRKDGVKKLLDHGRDISGDQEGNVYFAAKDGLYVYNYEENSAKKYGTLNESIIALQVEHAPNPVDNVINALSENGVLYRITENGTKADIDDRITDAQDIVMNIQEGSLFYYDANKNVYARTKNGTVNKIVGLPEKPSSIQFVRPPIPMPGGMFFIINDEDAYVAMTNGTSVLMDDKDNVLKTHKITAYSLEAGLLVYYSHEKKVYELNLAEIIARAISQFAKKWIEAIGERISAFFSE